MSRLVLVVDQPGLGATQRSIEYTQVLMHLYVLTKVTFGFTGRMTHLISNIIGTVII